LFESRAIGRYLETLGSGPELIPTEADPKARAKFEQAASIEYAQFSPILGDLIVEKIVKQARGQARDEGRIKELSAQLEAKLDVFDTILSRQKYLAGAVSYSPTEVPYIDADGPSALQRITLADLYMISSGELVFDHLGLGKLENRSHVQRQVMS